MLRRAIAAVIASVGPVSARRLRPPVSLTRLHFLVAPSFDHGSNLQPRFSDL
jgi:hypothetical protein